MVEARSKESTVELAALGKFGNFRALWLKPRSTSATTLSTRSTVKYVHSFCMYSEASNEHTENLLEANTKSKRRYRYLYALWLHCSLN